MIQKISDYNCFDDKTFIELKNNLNKKSKFAKTLKEAFALSNKNTEIKKYFDYVGTPTTINIVDGVEKNNLSRIDGADDYISVKEKLINWGYIKE